MRTTQRWEGYVERVEGDVFLARLVDLTNPANDDEVTEVSIEEEVSPGDRALVAPGAVFYWSIGYTRSPGGQLQGSSQLRFRRQPRWTAEELVMAERDAQALDERIGWTVAARAAD
jgi:hypothetical protein